MKEDIKLPQDFKNKWVEALRSGNYPQARGALFVENNETTGYCCLGVACKIVGIEDDKLTSYGDISDFSDDYGDEDGDKLAEIPIYLIDDSYGLIPLLIDMNDGKRIEKNPSSKSFEEIADWIEQNL
jgi:hypothetical protein